ncbi:uncharacterized protein LOC117597104 isoform X2 [Pangasianodon hypophthalmus]|uniref:uncharacterized protein LOC117597104 isoform X2 n=1 Tax=Pangasianodon hypophthalmus TaxID=310915 RepID=UPI002307064C|nr:uncharacterized protein LOC117597104 isoform X2 [Pangasianodon hypophthalmus]
MRLFPELGLGVLPGATSRVTPAGLLHSIIRLLSILGLSQRNQPAYGSAFLWGRPGFLLFTAWWCEISCTALCVCGPSSSSSAAVMSSHSLLVVLLVLTCLQSFTTAENPNGQGPCCFSYQTHKIPVRRITAYQKTYRGCENPGVIFILKSGRGVCADPEVKWVQNIMKKLPSA